jgi:type 1 glutamine amidotransferase
LKQYDAVVFLSTTGNILNDEQQKAFEEFIRSGKGFVGIHAAADTEYDWPWYGKLVGAYFVSHPKQQKAKLTITDHKHASTKHLPTTWERFDEWYNYKSRNNDVKVLMTIDESSYQGGKEGAYHPMAWYHSFDGGRSFYTALGHTDESYKEENFLKHLLGGIKYAVGK